MSDTRCQGVLFWLTVCAAVLFGVGAFLYECTRFEKCEQACDARLKNMQAEWHNASCGFITPATSDQKKNYCSNLQEDAKEDVETCTLHLWFSTQLFVVTAVALWNSLIDRGSTLYNYWAVHTTGLVFAAFAGMATLIFIIKVLQYIMQPPARARYYDYDYDAPRPRAVYIQEQDGHLDLTRRRVT